jgi:hypothetical protein
MAHRSTRPLTQNGTHSSRAMLAPLSRRSAAISPESEQGPRRPAGLAEVIVRIGG